MSTQKDRRLIVIVGPTGSGKSSLSLALAHHFDAPIISTDSRQLYRGIPIGTAQPSDEDLRAVEHYFIACRDLAEDYNAGEYEHDVLRCLGGLFESHDTVIAVGGSGLYIKALCEGFDELPEVSDEVREAVRSLYVSDGLDALLTELKERDPEFYEEVDRANSARVMRALEVCRASGGRYSDLRQGGAKMRDFEIVKVGLDLPRAELYGRIDRRVEQMMEMGLELEARSVYSLRHLNSLQTVGYREMFGCFDGEYDLSRAVELIQRNSRRYAKRQMTWFRRDVDIEWFEALSPEAVIKHIETKK
ncbi:MAG: tRNA (adenosine(37)-N6)-dimethylallyltransferase MiaA [Rikenellaceae bacterium]